jgi:hypothetical protein
MHAKSARGLALLLPAAALAACHVAHEPCPEPPLPRCAPSLDTAGAPLGGPRLLPERLSFWEEADAVEATFLVEEPRGSYQRITYHVALSPRSVSILGVEPLGPEWGARRFAELSASERGDRCEPIGSSVTVRALPSAETSGLEPPSREMFGPLIRGAIVIATEGVAEERLDVWVPEPWVPDPSSRVRTFCSRSILLLPGDATGTFLCVSGGLYECPSICAPGVPMLCRTHAGILDTCAPL